MLANLSKSSRNKRKFRLLVTDTYPKLIQFKNEDDQRSFNELVLQLMPAIRNYVGRRLNTAIKKGSITNGKYNPDDFIDQLFIEIYEHIGEVEDKKDFYPWLFKRTNGLLDDVIVDEEFGEVFYRNIDDYSKPEWDEMQEDFSTDGDGDLMLIEELDDMSYNHNDYVLERVFIEDKEKGMINRIDKEVSAEEFQNHIDMVLHNLPSAMRNVFDLFANQHLELDEIAKIRNSTIADAEQLLNDAKKALLVSFFKRFPQD
ncbi:MAG: sigma-70 family RNA polymerase sigma factor [Bacteroidia bacterium]|nr:sigma-70 family RNA polymerase sigma factor [Bacteroidia bacterium]